MPHCHTNLFLLAHLCEIQWRISWHSECKICFKSSEIICLVGLDDTLFVKKKFHRKEHWWADFWSAGQSATITAKWNAYLATSIHKPFHWRDTSSSHGSRYLEHIWYRVCLQNAALLSTFLPKIRPSQYTFPKAYHSGYTMYLSFF